MPRLLAALAGLLISWPSFAADLTVSAAASLANAFRELTPLFEARNPDIKVQLNFAASGALLQQIARGAPVDVFASADQETMDRAQAQGLVKAGERRNFVSNALVVIVPAQVARQPQTLADLTQASYRRIAIGLPASVPAGLYARNALESAGLWAAIAPKTIGAQSVRQALDYVARGEVDAGFVYATDAAIMRNKVKVALKVATTQTILYPIAPVAASPNHAIAQEFAAFAASPAAQAVLAKYGFGKP
jgi:molybdate transport system substrate-binding protein